MTFHDPWFCVFILLVLLNLALVGFRLFVASYVAGANEVAKARQELERAFAEAPVHSVPQAKHRADYQFARENARLQVDILKTLERSNFPLRSSVSRAKENGLQALRSAESIAKSARSLGF